MGIEIILGVVVGVIATVWFISWLVKRSGTRP